MNYRCIFIFLTVIGTSISMDKPEHPSTPSKSSKSHVVRPTRPKGSVIVATPIPRHRSTKALSDSLNQRIGSQISEAIKGNDYDGVKALLLTQGEAVHFVSDSHNTLIFTALTAPTYNDKILAKLIEYHADPNQKVDDVEPLKKALQLTNGKAALRLIYAGAKVLDKVEIDPALLSKELFYEIKKSRIDRVKHLLALNAPINVHSLKSAKSKLGDDDTPLLCTITDPKDFNKELFDTVLGKADPNLCALTGLTPLHKAIVVGNDIAAIMLLDKNADYKRSIRIQNKDVSAQQLAQEMHLNTITAAIAKKVDQPRQTLIKALEESTTPDYKTIVKSPRASAQKP